MTTPEEPTPTADSSHPEAEIVEPAEETGEEMVSEPLKLVRIASMVQILLN